MYPGKGSAEDSQIIVGQLCTIGMVGVKGTYQKRSEAAKTAGECRADLAWS